MNLSYQIKTLIHSLQKELDLIEIHLSKLPSEDLYCMKNGKYYNWASSKKGQNKIIYIKKQDRHYAEALAANKYYTIQYIRITKELKLLNNLLQNLSKIKENPSTLLENSSPYKHLLDSKFNSFSEAINEWINTPFEHNSYYSEFLLHKTLQGHFVRSKSEAIIANTLFLNNIPYRYEAALHFDDITFYPDFTICHPQTLNIIYWEHFGLMDKLQYREKAFNKLREYGNNDIIPSINLIATFETAQHPLDSSKINTLIHETFLSN